MGFWWGGLAQLVRAGCNTKVVDLIPVQAIHFRVGLSDPFRSFATQSIQ